ncbi:MAG: hypothetical protein NW226_19670 [Microscillaceae bacterium]|nr:hypothetical protein [Microscillaceae bacterium]
MGQDEFYIGWQAKAPQSYAQWTRLVIPLIFVLVLVVAVLYPLNQQGFSNSTSELGKFTKIEGVIYKYPVPMLKVKIGENLYQNLLLVGFGKQDALPTLEYLEQQFGNLEAYRMVLNAEMVYYEGRTVLEVPFSQNKKIDFKKLDKPLPPQKIESLGKVTLQGEIVDSKCYLGVMKPGFGKIHQSCGVRCISGGIPPMLVTQNGKGASNYFILIGAKGEPIGKDLLPFVGKAVKISGELEKVDEWMVLKINPENVHFYASTEFESVYYTGN